ncbi:type II toxin-antitoxin system HigB family toxin [Opitutales bacterium]|nr:type II toxin-antitoxin system HigB family toxin [Opitutales bacterium]
MRVITTASLLELASAHADSLPSVKQWLSTVQHAAWGSLTDIRNTFNSTDLVHLDSGRTVYVFNVRSYRLIAAIHFTPKNPNRGRLYVLEFLTHAEYDKNTWKERN